MRPGILLAVWVVVCLSLVVAQEQQVPLGHGKRRRSGQRRAKKVTSGQAAKQGRQTARNGDAGAAISFNSYKNVNEQESNYNVIPGSFLQTTVKCIFWGTSNGGSKGNCMPCYFNKIGINNCDMTKGCHSLEPHFQ